MNFTCMSACDVRKSREIGMLLVYCLPFLVEWPPEKHLHLVFIGTFLPRDSRDEPKNIYSK